MLVSVTLALALPLALVHASRQFTELGEMELETDGNWNPDDSNSGEIVVDPDKPPEAFSQPCERGSDTTVFRHLRLGNYTPEEIMEARCDEPLLVLLQRELQRMQSFEYHDTDVFKKKFPEEFMLNKKNRKLIMSTVVGSLTLLTAAASHLVVEVDNVVLNGDSIASYAEFCKEVITDDLEHPNRHAHKLVEKGASLETPFWRDIPLGALQDVYRVVSSSWRALNWGPAITVRKVKMYAQPHNAMQPLEEFEASTSLDYVAAEVAHAQQSSPYATVEKLENPERLVANGFVRVRYAAQEGWVEEDATAPWGWLTYTGKDKLPICFSMVTKCSEPSEVVGYIHSGQSFKVESLATFWHVIGSGGYISKSKGDLTGPLSREDSFTAQADAKALLSLDNKAVKDERVISSFNEAWNSKTATHSKFGLGIAITIGGIVTHGLGFLIAGIVFGVGSAGTDAALAIKTTEQIMSKVTYMELALLHFELDLVSGTTNHQTCDLNKKEMCPDGFACVRDLVFVHREQGTHHLGWCVAAPYSHLKAADEPCAVDLDCLSGTCVLSTEGGLVAELSGKCAA